jgi:hypothetical protein
MVIVTEPTKDAFISDKILNPSGQLATGSNTGLAGALVLFHFSGSDNPISANAIENSRILMEFDLDQYNSYSSIGFVPSSASYVLRMYDAPVDEYLPGGFEVEAVRISGTFAEGNGFDIQGISDLGSVNWVSRSMGSAWNTPGGDFFSGSVSQLFSTGNENLDLDITPLVSDAISSGSNSLGICLKFPANLETGSTTIDPKVFYSRQTLDYLKRPRLIASQTGDVTLDRRGGVITGQNTSGFMYNTSEGSFANVPGVSSGTFLTSSNSFDVVVTSSNEVGFQAFYSGSYVKDGFYSFNLFVPMTGTLADNINASGSIKLYDWWYRPGDDQLIHSGEIDVIKSTSDGFSVNSYRSTIKNLREEYDQSEVPILVVFTQDISRDRSAVSYLPKEGRSVYFSDLRYEVRDSETGALIIEDSEATRTSVSVDGNYFYFPMSNLSPGRVYEFNFFATTFNQKFKVNKSPQKFKIKMPVTVDGNA